jgi:hypothetical protein
VEELGIEFADGDDRTRQAKYREAKLVLGRIESTTRILCSNIDFRRRALKHMRKEQRRRAS